LKKPAVKQIAVIGNIGIGDWGKFPRTVDVSTFTAGQKVRGNSST